MPTITSLGVGSGIDVNGMVNQLVAVESRPLAQMKTAASQLNTQVSALGKLSSLVADLQSAADVLSGASLWTRSSASSSNEAAVAVIGGGNAPAGSYAVSVSALAAPQTLASAVPFGAVTDRVGAGTLTIDFGRWTPPAPPAILPSGFVANGRSLTLSVSDTDTLQTLRDKINAAGGGVTASIVTDANGSRLALRGAAAGAENGFRITVADNDGDNGDAAGLSRLAFDPDANIARLGYSQGASDAQAVVNGIAVRSTGNDLGGVVEGLTLRLRQTTSGNVDVTVSRDSQAVKDAVQKFADAYSALAREIAAQTKYDAATKVAGTLQGDSAVASLLSRLRGVINNPSGAVPGLPRLSDIGLQLQRDGTLKVDATRLDAAMADPAALKKAFGNLETGNPGNDGFMRRFSKLATDALGNDGILATRTEGLRKLIAKNQDQQDRFQVRIERYRDRLVSQFSAMDSNLSKLNALQSYVTQQLAGLQKANNG